MQKSYTDLFDHLIPEDEMRLLTSYPFIWMVGLASGYNNDEIIKLLDLANSDTSRREPVTEETTTSGGENVSALADGENEDDVIEIITL